jgi:hypothetical protein
MGARTEAQCTGCGRGAGASAERPVCEKRAATIGVVSMGPRASRLRIEGCPLGNAAWATWMVCVGMTSQGSACRDLGSLLW